MNNVAENVAINIKNRLIFFCFDRKSSKISETKKCQKQHFKRKSKEFLHFCKNSLWQNNLYQKQIYIVSHLFLWLNFILIIPTDERTTKLILKVTIYIYGSKGENILYTGISKKLHNLKI